jgi:hypothetical protein
MSISITSFLFDERFALSGTQFWREEFSGQWLFSLREKSANFT